MPTKPNSPGARGSTSPRPTSSPAVATRPVAESPAAGSIAVLPLPVKSCRNCAHARLHVIRFPDVPEFEKEVRVCAADSPCWPSVVTSEAFFTNAKKWKERAAHCPAYRRKLGAR